MATPRPDSDQAELARRRRDRKIALIILTAIVVAFVLYYLAHNQG